ncbi:MAG: DUF6090 family protein [Algoriphagus sp.]|uniref:DUF6090 family protein n=1 Tax=Algoriphagus sp. TaxID=1872435 RepID=UPI00263963D8|nr:DUF6090 family protein [Algoriphagus sp.]MDG1277838.1 DUF6090 family protein [Algoriphagus sp.]
MISFLRKIRQKLLSQNRVTRYLAYAVGEIALVMIGILLALQVNNWNEERKDKKKEEAFLNQIHIEFTENKIQFEKVRGFHSKSLKSCDWMLANQPFKSVSLDSLRYHSLWSRVAYTFDPSQSSIESLVNTGNINLIQDIALRKALIGWQDLIIDYLEEEKEMREFTTTHVIPFSMDNFKLYNEAERFDAVLSFDQKQLDKYLNLIARKKRILQAILYGFVEQDLKEDRQTEVEKVVKAMDLIIDQTK